MVAATEAKGCPRYDVRLMMEKKLRVKQGDLRAGLTVGWPSVGLLNKIYQPNDKIINS